MTGGRDLEVRPRLLANGDCPHFHHICLRREATSMVPESAAVSSIFTSVLEPWKVCSSKHLMTFSVRKRLRPPYTWPSEVFGWLVIWKRSGTTQVRSLRARVIAT